MCEHPLSIEILQQIVVGRTRFSGKLMRQLPLAENHEMHSCNTILAINLILVNIALRDYVLLTST